MKRDYLWKAFLILLMGCLDWAEGFAQQISINGIVKDTSGEPIIGANVIVKGTTNGTITDLDGNFQLSADPDVTIVVSYVGFQTQELPAQPIMNIVLKEDSELLDEVVVIGYGSVKKNDLSGSVVAIKADDINKGAVTSPQELVSMIVAKAANMAKMMNVPVLGLVENMSYAVCPDCGKRINIYGDSHILEIAQSFGYDVLGQIPLDSKLATLCDSGKIEDLDADYLDIAATVLEHRLGLSE